MDKLLIIQTGFLGDAVLASSILWALQDINIEVGMLIRKEYEQIYTSHPRVNNLHLLDKKQKSANKKMILELKSYQYNFAVVPHRSFRSSFIAKAANINHRAGFRQAAGSFLLNHKVDYNILEHERFRNFNLLKAVLPQEYLNEILLSKEITNHTDGIKTWLVANRQNNIIANNGKKIVVIAPGSVWETKRWKLEGFKEVTQILIRENYYVCLIGSQSEKYLADEIFLSLSEEEKKGCKNFAGEISLAETVSVIENCEFAITNDSAPLHIAESLGKPVIAMFGATVPEFGFAPLLYNSSVLQVDLPCRPCGIHGSPTCPINSLECMQMITTDMVLEKIPYK